MPRAFLWKEAWSVEDNGAGICFNVFISNVEDDCEIDYATGDYELLLGDVTYVYNKRNGKLHEATCTSVRDMSDANKIELHGTYEEAIAELEEKYGIKVGQISYCGSCKPQN